MTDPSRTPYLARLPYGERLSLEPLLGDELFPFEGEPVLRPLAMPTFARAGASRSRGRCER